MARSVALLCCGVDPTLASMNARSVRARLHRCAETQVVQTLKSREFRIVSCLDWHVFRRRAAATHAAVVVASRADLDGWSTGLRAIVHDDFPCPLILVTRCERENLRYLSTVRVNDVVFHDEIACRLTQALTATALSDGRRRLRTAIHGGAMHLTLKRALLRLVDLPLPLAEGSRAPYRVRTRDTGAWQVPHSFPRTVEDLADLACVTSDYLRHLAANADLPLGRILREHAAVRALEMLAAGASANIVAERFGYVDASGVRKLIARNLGGTRAAASVATRVEAYYERTASVFEPMQDLGSMPPGRSESRTLIDR